MKDLIDKFESMGFEVNKNIDITFSKDELRDLLLMVNDYRWECDLKKPKSHYKSKLKYHSRKL